MKKTFSFLVFLFMLQVALADLKIDFYKDTCPGAEKIISDVVQSAFDNDHSITAALLRMYFHDCFNAKCDASILINSTDANPSEKVAEPNLTVRGYDLIDKAKEALEKVCPLKVSCADIIAIATRDAVTLAGGPHYAIPTGRLDGLESDPNKVNLPGPSITVFDALQQFRANRLDTNDTVALLGGHTVGIAHCRFFRDRLSSSDRSMHPILFRQLQEKCFSSNNTDPTANLDQQTPLVFDNKYYNQIQMRRGILQIDQRLAFDKLTAAIVNDFALNPDRFKQSFANAMVKLGNLVANVGEVRRDCRAFNKAPQRQNPDNSNSNQKPNSDVDQKQNGSTFMIVL